MSLGSDAAPSSRGRLAGLGIRWSRQAVAHRVGDQRGRRGGRRRPRTRATTGRGPCAASSEVRRLSTRWPQLAVVVRGDDRLEPPQLAERLAIRKASLSPRCMACLIHVISDDRNRLRNHCHVAGIDPIATRVLTWFEPFVQPIQLPEIDELAGTPLRSLAASMRRNSLSERVTSSTDSRATWARDLRPQLPGMGHWGRASTST